MTIIRTRNARGSCVLQQTHIRTCSSNVLCLVHSFLGRFPLKFVSKSFPLCFSVLLLFLLGFFFSVLFPFVCGLFSQGPLVFFFISQPAAWLSLVINLHSLLGTDEVSGDVILGGQSHTC